MIYKTNYKDRPAVALSCDAFSALFLPEDGGKLTALKTADGNELLEQAKGDTYERLGINSNYVDCECSAFDDMFPTIDPCTIGSFRCPDHGEVCRVPHRCTIDEASVSFECIAESVNAIFRKTVYTSGNTLYIEYNIQNNNNFSLPYIWAGHMMFAGSYGAYVTGNFTNSAAKRIMFGNAPSDDIIHVQERFTPDGESYKYYFCDPISPLECGIVYPDSNRKVTVSFDGDAVRYLGVWINNGSFKQMYNIALEPCTAPYDSPKNAEIEKKGSYIPANGNICFTMRLRIDNIC